MGKGERTRDSLERALRRVETGRVRLVKPGRKLSISAVAEEAGLHPATLHTRYPDIAEQIRQKLNRGVRRQRDDKQRELDKLRETNRGLHAELAENRTLLKSMASHNAQLVVEVEALRAMLESERVVRFGS